MDHWMLLGLGYALQPGNIAVMVLGVVIGMIFGATPGLSGAAAMTMLLPLTFLFPAQTGVLFLLAIWNAAVYAGSIPSILLNIPGTAAAAATAIEGHLLARRGLARRALRASIVGSTIGGIAAAASLLFMSPPLASLSLLFGPAEMFSFALFGMATVISLSSGSLLRGLIGALIGLAMATVGFAPDGSERFVFTPDFLDGFPLIPTLVGMFTIPVVLNLVLEQRPQIARDLSSLKAADPFLLRLSDWTKHWFNILRSAIIGVVVGVLPGTGPTIAAFVSYGEARRAAKPPHEFGKGDVGGVLASETANNAAVFSSLVPAITLGIPGSVDAVIILAALTMHGLMPGPTLFERSPEIVYTVFMGAFVTNVIMLVVGLFGAKYIAQFTRIRLSLMVPVILTLGLLGAFAVHNNIFDVFLALGVGLFGFVLHRFGISLAALVLGLILGDILEVQFYQAVTLYDNAWQAFFERPISLLFILLAFASIGYSLWKDYRERRVLAMG